MEKIDLEAKLIKRKLEVIKRIEETKKEIMKLLDESSPYLKAEIIKKNNEKYARLDATIGPLESEKDFLESILIEPEELTEMVLYKCKVFLISMKDPEKPRKYGWVRIKGKKFSLDNWEELESYLETEEVQNWLKEHAEEYVKWRV